MSTSFCMAMPCEKACWEAWMASMRASAWGWSSFIIIVSVLESPALMTVGSRGEHQFSCETDFWWASIGVFARVGH